jgi:hypothetical protein
MAASLTSGANHRLRAVLDGFEPLEKEFSVIPDTVVTQILALKEVTGALIITSDPPRARVVVDGQPRGETMINLADLKRGPQRIRASLPGHVGVDTTINVTGGTQPVHLTLRKEPPGTLVLKGDSYASMWIDDKLVMADSYNSGNQPVVAGPHRIKVRILNGEEFEADVSVGPGELVVYDFTRKEVTQRNPIKESPP